MHTGAELVNWRRNGQRHAVVRYRLGGRRFECVIDTESLQIMDAGICLSGTDEELNLSSLPSAVREAIESGSIARVQKRLNEAQPTITMRESISDAVTMKLLAGGDARGCLRVDETMETLVVDGSMSY